MTLGKSSAESEKRKACPGSENRPQPLRGAGRPRWKGLRWPKCPRAGSSLVGFLVLVRPQVGLGFQVRSAKTFCL